MTSSVLWDGSYLGIFSKECIQNTIRKNKSLVFYTLCLTEDNSIKTEASFENVRILCQLRRPKDIDLPCVFDEMKSTFGIDKIGTHRIVIGKTKYLMYRATLSDTLVSKTSAKEKILLRPKMQEQVIFRMLCSIPNIQNGNFLVRKYSNAMSFQENKTQIIEGTSFPTESFLRFWFGDEDRIDNHIQEFLEKRSAHFDDKLSFVTQLRKNLEKTVQRVHPESIWIVAYIIEKVHKIIS